MNQVHNLPARMALALAIIVVALFAVPQAAQAQWIVRGDTIPAGEVIENDVILTGTNVTVNGTVNGDVVAVGSSVSINGTTTGSLVVAGREVSLNGEVGGSVYVAGRTLRLGPASQIDHNVHFGGVLLDSAQGSKIGRDLVAASVRASIGSEIGRGLNAIIALLSFHGKIGFSPQEGSAGELGFWQPGTGEPSESLLFVGLGGQKVAGYAAPMRIPLFQQSGESGGVGVPEWFVARLGELVALLLVGALAVWLLPSWLDRSAGSLRGRPLAATGYGVLAAIIFVNGIGIALLLAAMLVGVGLWLGSVTLWELAFLFWGIGFSLLVLAGSLFALAVFYGSKVIVAYLVGFLILKRLAPRAAAHRIVALLLGLAIYMLLRAIPHLGWVIEIVAIILGLGAIWLVAFRKREPVQAAGEAAEQETTALEGEVRESAAQADAQHEGTVPGAAAEPDAVE